MSIESDTLRTRLVTEGGWRNAVTWKDGYGRFCVVVKDGPNAWAHARRAIAERFGDEIPRGYALHLRTVEVIGGLREYIEWNFYRQGVTA